MDQDTGLLDEFDIWWDQAFDGADHTDHTRSYPDVPTPATRADIFLTDRAGRITLWANGDCHAEVISMRDGMALFNQHLAVAPHEDFDAAFAAFRCALGMRTH